MRSSLAPDRGYAAIVPACAAVEFDGLENDGRDRQTTLVTTFVLIAEIRSRRVDSVAAGTRQFSVEHVGG